MPNVYVLKDHLKAHETFDVDIKGKIYHIPHSGKLGREDLKTFKAIQNGDYEAMYELLGHLIGEEVANSLNLEELEAIYKGWMSFIKEAEGATLGES